MYKQVIVIRKDIKMGKGKMIAHCIHAAIGAMQKADEDVVDAWNEEGGKKVVLKIKDLKSLNDVYKKAKAAEVSLFLVRDAGLTQLKKGTATCVGIGPDDSKKIDRITGKLKLL